MNKWIEESDGLCRALAVIRDGFGGEKSLYKDRLTPVTVRECSRMYHKSNAAKVVPTM